MDNNSRFINSNLRTACLLALATHVALIVLFSLSSFKTNKNIQKEEMSLNVVFSKPPKEKTDNAHTKTTEDIPKPSPTTSKQADTLTKEKQTIPPTISLTPSSIKMFTHNDAVTNKNENSDSLSNFKESFVIAKIDRTRNKDSYLIETYNGLVDVKTDFLGKKVCYTFNPDSDFGVANFHKCDNDVEFKFKKK